MNILLVVAGALSALAALAHIGCIYFGAFWYRFFGFSSVIHSGAALSFGSGAQQSACSSAYSTS